MSATKYRARDLHDHVIGLSISYQADNLLARGIGLAHLKELLIRLGRPLLRHGACLAYGGHWEDKEDNFTFDLLRLISAEQDDNTGGGPDSNLPIGRLYNHLAWPGYLKITPKIEAQWINSCRIVRVTQAMAGFTGADVVPDAAAANDEPRASFNRAVTLSAMRRLAMQESSIDIPDALAERVPPICSRVLLGGKIDDFSGFMPGIFEEALCTLETEKPLFILGGFGGAAELLARAILATGCTSLDELTLNWHTQRNPKLTKLVEATTEFAAPADARTAPALFDALHSFVTRARNNPSTVLRTGLTDDDTRQLLITRDIATAVRLVRQGLVKTDKLPA